jgi:hypothetical protein
MLGQPQWGIFGSTGGTVLAADAVMTLEYAHDYKVSDYPQEKGAFQSYNKVQIPYQHKVTFAVASERKAFLDAVEVAVGSLDLFTVVTPEISYPSVNLTHVGYRRIANNGVTTILVDVWCEEIRIIGSENLSNTRSTNGAGEQNNGPVQAQDPGNTGPDLAAPA